MGALEYHEHVSALKCLPMVVGPGQVSAQHPERRPGRFEYEGQRTGLNPVTVAEIRSPSG